MMPSTTSIPFRNPRDDAKPRRYSIAELRESQILRLRWAIALAILDSGYPSCTVMEISRRAHVSTRTFYEHFDSKESLFLDAYSAGVGFVESYTEERLSTCESWPDRLVTLAQAPVETFGLCKDFFAGMLIGSISIGPSALAARANAHERWAALMRRELAMIAHVDPAVSELFIEPNVDLSLSIIAAAESLVRRALMRGALEQLLHSISSHYAHLLTAAAGLSLADLQRLDQNFPQRVGLRSLIEVHMSL